MEGEILERTQRDAALIMYVPYKGKCVCADYTLHSTMEYKAINGLVARKKRPTIDQLVFCRAHRIGRATHTLNHKLGGGARLAPSLDPQPQFVYRRELQVCLFDLRIDQVQIHLRYLQGGVAQYPL
jgi:hypothetical protein